MNDSPQATRFQEQVLAHLDAAYNLARWITRDAVMAKDGVQEGCLRAFRAFEQMQGPNAKAWFLAVIRNTCLDLLRDQRRQARSDEYDDELHGAAVPFGGSASPTPEELAERVSDARWLHECLSALPREYREVIVLRELEELSYREISVIVDIPMGTVMSRLARGRALLQQRVLHTYKRSTR